VIPTQILRVLSTIRQFDVHALLMGGQACVLYGAAEYSRDLDLAVLATADALPKFSAAMRALNATVIAVPQFESEFLARGHAVHFSVPDENSSPLRVDVMSRMRGVAAFDELWARRATVALPTTVSGAEVTIELMALEDLVQAKKTQRDKDWPMLRRLVDASYDGARDRDASEAEVAFWFAELRSPEFLRDVVERFPEHAARVSRPAVMHILAGRDGTAALAEEQAEEMAADRVYWLPLRRELESLRFAARRGG
jgi:hypothetical protein